MRTALGRRIRSLLLRRSTDLDAGRPSRGGAGGAGAAVHDPLVELCRHMVGSHWGAACHARLAAQARDGGFPEPPPFSWPPLPVGSARLDAATAQRIGNGVATWLDSLASVEDDGHGGGTAAGMEDGNEGTCSKCFGSGDLLCCDGCPQAFHLSCLAMTHHDVPPGKWLCPQCKRAARSRRRDEDPPVDAGSHGRPIAPTSTSGVTPAARVWADAPVPTGDVDVILALAAVAGVGRLSTEGGIPSSATGVGSKRRRSTLRSARASATTAGGASDDGASSAGGSEDEEEGQQGRAGAGEGSRTAPLHPGWQAVPQRALVVAAAIAHGAPASR
jgi:hypothetical protein